MNWFLFTYISIEEARLPFEDGWVPGRRGYHVVVKDETNVPLMELIRSDENFNPKKMQMMAGFQM